MPVSDPPYALAAMRICGDILVFDLNTGTPEENFENNLAVNGFAEIRKDNGKVLWVFRGGTGGDHLLVRMQQNDDGWHLYQEFDYNGYLLYAV